MSEVQENALHRRGVRGLEESERLEDFEMREILFRGKVADEPDEWVYGYLLPDARIIQTVEFTENKCCGVGTFQIRPETVGQYTGLTDKNGKKIFEGDIVKTTLGITRIVFDKCRGFGGYSDQKRKTGSLIYLQGIDLAFGEIIGNIHDNPELLK